MSYYQPYYYGIRHNHRTHFDSQPCKYLYKWARQLLSWNLPFLAVTEPAARDRISSRWISSLKHLSRAAITCPHALWDNLFQYFAIQCSMLINSKMAFWFWWPLKCFQFGKTKNFILDAGQYWPRGGYFPQHLWGECLFSLKIFFPLLEVKIIALIMDLSAHNQTPLSK